MQKVIVALVCKIKSTNLLMHYSQGVENLHSPTIFRLHFEYKA